jgi:hypothetical protein
MWLKSSKQTASGHTASRQTANGQTDIKSDSKNKLKGRKNAAHFAATIFETLNSKSNFHIVFKWQRMCNLIWSIMEVEKCNKYKCTITATFHWCWRTYHESGNENMKWAKKFLIQSWIAMKLLLLISRNRFSPRIIASKHHICFNTIPHRKFLVDSILKTEKLWFDLWWHSRGKTLLLKNFKLWFQNINWTKNVHQNVMVSLIGFDISFSSLLFNLLNYSIIDWIICSLRLICAVWKGIRVTNELTRNGKHCHCC